MAAHTRNTLLKNAEVTSAGIKARGSPTAKQKSKLITRSTTPEGKFKRQLITGSTLLLAATVAIGLYIDWTGTNLDLHSAWILSTITSINLLTIFFTKME